LAAGVAALGALERGTGSAAGGRSLAAPEAGNPSPTGTGQPSQSCQDFPTLTRPPGIVSTTNGFATTAVNVYANVTGTTRVSQYDVACFQVSQH
jgi:hypothetical protein